MLTNTGHGVIDSTRYSYNTVILEILDTLLQLHHRHWILTAQLYPNTIK